MLKIKQSKGLYRLYLNRSRVLLACVVALIVFGALALKRVWATGEEGPTLTLESVSQYGEPIEPDWDPHLFRGLKSSNDWGDYYYQVANNMDKVTVGVRVNGLEEGKSYKVFNDRVITAADNDTVIYGEMEPTVSMGSYTCHENEWGWEECEGDIHANEYTVTVVLSDDEWTWYGTVTAVLRPVTVGSSDIEILSVKQDGVDVYLDTVGRQENSLNVPQTINEYQLMDYTKPVTIEFKAKNLHVGWQYSLSAGSEQSMSATADASEMVGSVDVDVSALSRHASVQMSFYGYNPSGYGGGDEMHESSVKLYFNIADENFVSLGDLVIGGIGQGGEMLDVTENELAHEYTLNANDVQDLEVALRATDATDGLNYYVGYSLNPASSYYYGASGWIMVSGAELKDGLTLMVPAKYGESENSPFELNLYMRTTGGTWSYSSKPYCWEQCENGYTRDTVMVNFEVDPNIPRYAVDYGYVVYQGGQEIEPNNEGVYMISDYTKPISLKVNVDDDRSDYSLSGNYVSLDDDGNEIEGRHNSQYGVPSTVTGGVMQYGANVYLDVSAKTTRLDLAIYDVVVNEYGSYSQNRKLEEFTLQFAYADYDSAHIPSLGLIEMRQGGVVVNPDSEYNYKVFRLNSIQDYTYSVKGHNLLDGIEYSSYENGIEHTYSKSDLENGVTITRSASDASRGLVGSSNYSAVFGYNLDYPMYDGKPVQVRTDNSLNGDLAFFDTCVKYREDEDCLSGSYPSHGLLPSGYGVVEDVEDYDAEYNPLELYIKGDNYVDDVDYEVNVKVRYGSELLTEDNFTVTGLSIKNGVEKEYFDELRFETLDQMLDGSFEEIGYNVEVTIDEMTRSLEFMANGETNAISMLFTPDGLTIPDYSNNMGGGMGFAGGNRFVGYGEWHISREIFGDHAYMYLGALMDDIEGANYHIYYHPASDNPNDLRGATLMREGEINADEGVGLLRLERDEMENFYYTLVIEKNGRILAVMHHEMYLDDIPATYGLAVSARTEEEDALVGYHLTREVPVKVMAYGTRFDESKTYTAGIVVRANSVKTYEEYANVTGAELNGDTELFTVQYNDMFRQNASSCSIEFVLKGENGGTMLNRSIHLARGDGDGDMGFYENELVYAMIRALEQGGEGPDEPEEVIVDNKTPEEVDVVVEGGTLTAVSETPVTVVGFRNDEWVKLFEWDVVENGEERTNHYSIGDCDEVKVVLKGDGDMDGEVSSADSNLINRSLISSSLRPYRELSELERIIFDLDGDNEITSSDSNLINRSLISSSLRPYKAIEW